MPRAGCAAGCRWQCRSRFAKHGGLDELEHILARMTEGELPLLSRWPLSRDNVKRRRSFNEATRATAAGQQVVRAGSRAPRPRQGQFVGQGDSSMRYVGPFALPMPSVCNSDAGKPKRRHDRGLLSWPEAAPGTTGGSRFTSSVRQRQECGQPETMRGSGTQEDACPSVGTVQGQHIGRRPRSIPPKSPTRTESRFTMLPLVRESN